MGSEKPCYLYGIVRSADADQLRSLRGVAGAPVSAVTSGPLTAIVSELENTNLRATRTDLLAHSDVLQAVVERCDVLPVSFGHIYARPEHVRQDLLERDAAGLQSILDELVGCVEVHVKVWYVEETVAQELLRSDRKLQRLRTGRQDHARQVAMGQRFAGLLEARRIADSGRIVDRVARFATAASTGQPPGEFGVVKAAFLVPRSGVAALLDEVEHLGAESQLITIETTGPMAPYSFVGDAFGEAA